MDDTLLIAIVAFSISVAAFVAALLVAIFHWFASDFAIAVASSRRLLRGALAGSAAFGVSLFIAVAAPALAFGSINEAIYVLIQNQPHGILVAGVSLLIGLLVAEHVGVASR